MYGMYGKGFLFHFQVSTFLGKLYPFKGKHSTPRICLVSMTISLQAHFPSKEGHGICRACRLTWQTYHLQSL